MKKTIVLGILVFVGLVLSIYGFVVLPDNVVVQVGACLLYTSDAADEL